MAWEVLTMAPRMSGRLRRIPPMCESLKSDSSWGCENSDSTSSSFQRRWRQVCSCWRRCCASHKRWSGLIDFTHGKIEVSGIAVLHCQMVQYCFRQIGSTSLQDMWIPLWTENFRQMRCWKGRNVQNVHQWNGRISVCRRWIGYDWKYSWWCFVGILHVFLCPFTEVKVSTVSSVFSHSSNDLELSLCPSKVGGMTRTGGMTKGLLGFIGVFQVIYSVRRRRRRRLPGLLMWYLIRYIRQTFRRILALSESVRHCWKWRRWWILRTDR